MASKHVLIGSARIDENGHATGGKAGDQTGKEVSTQNWYKHSKGWRVFRAKSAEVANKIAQDMEYACKNNNIGYDQNQRGTLYTVSKAVGFDCKKVKEKCETDCSALVRVCCAYAGIMLPNFRTSDEAKTLLNSGAFIEMKGAKYTDSENYLCRGDILVTATKGHTVVVLTSGKYADEQPTEFTQVLVTGGSVYVRSAPDIKTGKVLGVVHKGDMLPYGGKTSDNNWYLVEYKNMNGWISGKYSILSN